MFTLLTLRLRTVCSLERSKDDLNICTFLHFSRTHPSPAPDDLQRRQAGWLRGIWKQRTISIGGYHFLPEVGRLHPRRPYLKCGGPRSCPRPLLLHLTKIYRGYVPYPYHIPRHVFMFVLCVFICAHGVKPVVRGRLGPNYQVDLRSWLADTKSGRRLDSITHLR